MRRNRNVFIAAAVVAGLVIVFLATRSDGTDGAGVRTTSTKNCPPVARMDAVATTPTAPVSIDVLANDTDPDGDPLIFQILTTTGGTATVDDGATPTDASDDRVLFTPAVPAPPAAVVEYQAIDPRGAIATSTIEVSINDLGALPAGLQSEAVTSDDTADASGCDNTTQTTRLPGTTLSPYPTTSLIIDGQFDTPPSGSPTTSKKSSSKNTTTTTKKNSTTSTPSNTGGHGGTTQPTNPPPTFTTTTQPSGPTTTKPTPTTKDCGPRPDPQQDPEGFSDWSHCTYGY
jgi:hypothetical protein